MLSFDQPRRRIAAWLAEPAPIGALEYVSPDATLTAAFAMQDMATLVEELFLIIGTAEPNFDEQLDEFQQLNGIDIQRDFAAALGGEFVFAVDGPLLPKPSWKLAVEVYDPARLQQSLEWVVEQVNAELAGSEHQGLGLTHEQVGAREYYMLESLDTGIQVHYIYDDGYVVFAPSRALIDRALQARTTGIQLTDAPDFVDLLPHDEEVNFSAAFYHNLGPVLGPLSRALSGSGLGDLSPDQTQFVQQLAVESKPGLLLAYGEPSRIVFTSDAEGGLFTVPASAHSPVSAGCWVCNNPSSVRWSRPTPVAEAGPSTTIERGQAAYMSAVIELDGLCLKFGRREILKNLHGSFSGRAIGLLGPNGAGKTTLLHTLLGFHPLSAGSARIFGRDISNDGKEIRGQIGYMPERESFMTGMTAVRLVRLMAELSGLHSKLALERAHEALFYVGLGEARYRKLESYSLGMKQLAKLAQAIVHGPRLLFLDEPTNGSTRRTGGA